MNESGYQGISNDGAWKDIGELRERIYGAKEALSKLSRLYFNDGSFLSDSGEDDAVACLGKNSQSS